MPVAKRARIAAKKGYKTGRYKVAKGGFAAAVKKVIQSEAEKKKVQYYEVDHPVVAYNHTTVSWGSTIFPVTPYGASLTINQGTGDASRVGNRIKVHKLMLKGAFTPNGYNASSNPTPSPMMVRMWLLYDKENPHIIPSPTTDFIQNGASSQALSSSYLDMMSEVNADRWVVKYDRVFKVGFGTYGGTGTSAAFQSFTNNDFKLINEFEIDVTDMIPKTYVFDDNAAIPETRGLFMVCEAVTTTGLTANLATNAVELHFSLKLEYTDL